MPVYGNSFRAKFVAQSWLCIMTALWKRIAGGVDMASDQNPDESSKSPYDELTKLVQEAKSPEEIAARARIVAGNFLGNVPFGIDAANESAPNMIGGAGNLFEVLKYGFMGVIATALGAAFVRAGFTGQVDRMTFGAGAVLLALGVFALWRAVRGWKRLRAISRA
jgi:hypothetical protein